MSIYNEKPSPPDGRQITFSDSIDLIIQAMAAGNDIFNKTEEIPVVPWRLEAATKKGHILDHLSALSDHLRAEYIEGGISDFYEKKVQTPPGNSRHVGT